MDRRRLQHTLSLLGGFVVLVGIFLFGLCALIAFGYLDPGLLLEKKQLFIFGSIMLITGVFDLIVGIIVARW
jgi:hypothetical protein